MADHAWTLENLESYVAGGLDAEERGQLEQHVAECPDCGRALAEARAVDRRLEGLFAAVRPDPALEDRSIRQLRQEHSRPGALVLTRRAKLMLAAAAGVFLALLGAGMTYLMDEQGLPLPGVVAQNKLKRLAGGSGEISLEVHSLHDGKPKGESLGTDWPDDSGSMKETDELAAALLKKLDPERAYRGLINGKAYHGENYKTPAAAEPSSGTTTREASGATMAREGYVESLPAGKKGGVADGITNTEQSFPPSMGLIVRSPDKIHYKSTGGVLSPYYDPSKAFDEGRSGESKESKARDNEAANPKKTPAEEALLGKKGKGGEAEKHDNGKPPPPPEQQPVGRKVIRTGDMEFEVQSFDEGVVVITKLVRAIKGGFIATINSDKLANGKVRGTVVVRVPPESLDQLVLDLRKELGKTGELKGQRITSEDVSKKYTDYESKLRSARAMEERLLNDIRTGKGQIKDLVLAEQALGKYREQIEVMEGELRWLAHQVSLSTLSISLTEKEIRAAAAIKESEKVQASIEVDDVDKALRDTLEAVTEAKGRIINSELKQHAAGQYQAVVQFEVSSDKAGALRDQLRQLGTMTSLEVQRMQQAEGGVLGLKNGKTERGPTHFILSLYNLANIEPRETVTLTVASEDVPAAFRKLRGALAKGPNRVAKADLNETDRQNITATLVFDVRRKEEVGILDAVKESGEVLSRQTTRAAASDKVTDAKVGFQIDLIPASRIDPRETMTLGLRVADVDKTLTLFKAQVKEVRGRTIQPILRQDPDGRVTAHALFVVPLAAAPGLFEKFKAAGHVSGQRVDEDPRAPTGKLALAQLDVTLSNRELLIPANEGLWTQIDRGLKFSFRGLLWSLSWLIVGVLFVLPWVLLIWAVVWVIRRFVRTPTPATVAAAGGGTPASGG